jgi:hypothetical protein
VENMIAQNWSNLSVLVSFNVSVDFVKEPLCALIVPRTVHVQLLAHHVVCHLVIFFGQVPEIDILTIINDMGFLFYV